MNFPRAFKVQILLIGFFVCVLSGALIFESDFPVKTISGENSAGTWVSGALLVASGVFSLLLGLKRGLLPWSLIALSFAVLALDERFMFHEQMKFRLQFHYPGWVRFGAWVYELPVLVAGCCGLILAMVLYRRFQRRPRIFLAFAVLMGTVSAAIDVTHSGVFWEDACKLLAEICLVIAMLDTFDYAFGPFDKSRSSPKPGNT